MKHLFIDSNQRLRNGWWILIFIALLLLSRLIYTPVSKALQDLGTPKEWLEPLRLSFLLLVTWICLRLRKEALSSVGLLLDRRWLRQFAVGTLLGLASALLAVTAIWAIGGVNLELDPARSPSTLLYGAYLFLFVALFEETLFRGFLFQRLVDGAGVWIAQIGLGLLFATSHWGNQEMHGATLIWATIELFLGAVLLGLAYLRTRSLALPVGIHLGWNWAQGHLLGFGVSGFEHTGWFRPLFNEQPEWLTGGQFGPEASIFAVIVDLLLIAALWKWKGSEPASTPDAGHAQTCTASPASAAASALATPGQLSSPLT